MGKNIECDCENCACDDLVLADILQSEKNMTVNLSMPLNEMSNMDLYNKLFPIFKTVSGKAKELFTILYNSGYYQLEAEKVSKIEQKIQSLEKKLSN